MSAHVEQPEVIEETQRTRIPRPVRDGSYDVESLGPIVDRLLGDRRVRQRAAEAVRILSAEDEPDQDPADAPVEVPPPIPGGSEPVTRGDDPPAERR